MTSAWKRVVFFSFWRRKKNFVLSENLFKVPSFACITTVSESSLQHCTNFQSWYNRINIINFIAFNGTYTIWLTLNIECEHVRGPNDASKNILLNGFFFAISCSMNFLEDSLWLVYCMQRSRLACRSYLFSVHNIYQQEMTVTIATRWTNLLKLKSERY